MRPSAAKPVTIRGKVDRIAIRRPFAKGSVSYGNPRALGNVPLSFKRRNPDPRVTFRDRKEYDPTAVRRNLRIAGAPVDEARLATEVALLADRLDVTEECVRFRSHTKFFLQAFGAEESAGRKLNFLLQEMNREVNTMGSKADGLRVSELIIAAKAELEKMREQVQNVE